MGLCKKKDQFLITHSNNNKNINNIYRWEESSKWHLGGGIGKRVFRRRCVIVPVFFYV